MYTYTQNSISLHSNIFNTILINFFILLFILIIYYLLSLFHNLFNLVKKNKKNRQHKINFTMYLMLNSQNVNKMPMFPKSADYENKILYRNWVLFGIIGPSYLFLFF
jgi:hypothetical protein